MADEILRVDRNARVRFPYVEPTHDSDGSIFEVVRVVNSGGKPVKPDRDKPLIALRHAVRWRSALGAIAFAADRSLSAVVGRLLASPHAAQMTRLGLPMEILGDRGRPSSDADQTINIVVLRDTKIANAFTSDLVGEYCDQAYYLSREQIAKLEALAKALELSPGQVVDALVMKALVTVCDE